MTFKDKVIWITGASSGIGEAMTYAFAAHGAKLVISSRKEKELERVKANCHASAEVMVLPLDVVETAKFPQLVNQVIDRFGFINILINNAGISQRALAAKTDLQVDRRIMEVNFFGTVGLTKAVLPYMSKQQFGHIVTISSVLGKFGLKKRSAYCASKHALHGFFDTLRAEVAVDNIAVTVICPGFVTTNVTINALKNDGSTHAKMDENTAKGMSPEAFAQKALRAIARQKPEAWIGGPLELSGVYLKHFAPWLYRRMAKRTKV